MADGSEHEKPREGARPGVPPRAGGKAGANQPDADPSACKKLSKSHRDQLYASDLDDEAIRLAGLYTEPNPDAISRLVGWEYPARDVGTALVFPFPRLDGSPTTYFRVKLDKPITRKGKDKPSKYESPRGRSPEVYLPQGVRDPEVRKDSTVSIYFVEGEKKALCADRHGYPTIGLVGVWGWVRPKGDEADEGAGGEQCEREPSEDEPKELHPDLDEFEWKGRKVYIAFDSDVVYKFGPACAEWELARALIAKGAIVRIIRFPQKPGEDRVGLDDFFSHKGAKAFAKLIEQATSPTVPSLSFSNVARRLDRADPTKSHEVPRSCAEMATQLVNEAGGYPRMVGGLLVVPDSAGGVRCLESHHDLFAFASAVFDRGGESRVWWQKAVGAATPNTFYSYLKAECERFDRADPLPHEPPLARVLYTNPPPVPDGKFEALERFLSFFNPATEEDRALLLTAILTPFWGGPAGKRPGFLFESNENDGAAGRGVGKSTAAQKIAALSGGAFDIDASDPFSRTRSRLLTPEAGSYRVLLMDNVKTFRLSSADLESLITNPFINGHRLWHGQAGVPNYYTLYLTLNGASLARDVAQRVIPVRFARASFRSNWETELDAYLNANRQRIIGDILGLLRSKPGKAPRVSRWGKWEADVLSRVPHPERCAKLIDERTQGMDADQEDADRIRETWVDIVERSLGVTDAHACRLLLRSSAVTKLVELALNDRMKAGAASSQITAIGVKGFRKSPRRGLSMWLWQGDDYVQPERETTPPIVNYDREQEEWSTEIRRGAASSVSG